MPEDIAIDYQEYRAMMEELHMHNVYVDSAKYVDSYGLVRFLKHLVTYTENPAQSMLIQRTIEWSEETSNNELRNANVKSWV